MNSLTPTLLDPFEAAGISAAGAPLRTSIDGAEWLDMTTLPLQDILSFFDVEERNVPPPWTPEPVDRRWRARGWTED